MTKILHFGTWISRRPVGQSWSNFMCSITGGGERLHNVLRQIGSKLWCLWQQKAPIDLQWGKWCLHLFLVAFDLILFILAGNEDMHKISDEFDFLAESDHSFWSNLPLSDENFTHLNLNISEASRPILIKFYVQHHWGGGWGERVHKVLGQIGSKLWFPWQQKAPIDL